MRKPTRNPRPDENARLREALEPFAELARRLKWVGLRDDDPLRNEHVLEAPADDIAPGAVYCLHVSAFDAAVAALNK